MSGRCQHVKDDGEQCRMESGLREYEGELRCIWHDPQRAEKAMAARRRGGKASRPGGSEKGPRTVNPYDAPPAPETLEDAMRWASWVTWATTVGELDTQTAYAAMNALRTFIQAAEKVEAQEIWSEVEAIKARLEEAVA